MLLTIVLVMVGYFFGVSMLATILYLIGVAAIETDDESDFNRDLQSEQFIRDEWPEDNNSQI